MADNTLTFEAQEVDHVEEESRTTGEYLAWLASQRGGMTLADASLARHSVRSFLEKEIEEEKADVLKKAVEEINSKTSLNFKLMLNEPKAFSKGEETEYGQFSNCKNYFALVGPKGRDTEVGYWGEHLVLLAQLLGLNTCWVALTYRKRRVPIELEDGEKFYLVIALGYGANQGKAHVSKPIDELCTINGAEMPEWFEKAMCGAQLAPTAVNQQKFRMILNEDGTVTAKVRIGALARLDLGIVKYHFEIGAGEHSVEWQS